MYGLFCNGNFREFLHWAGGEELLRRIKMLIKFQNGNSQWPWAGNGNARKNSPKMSHIWHYGYVPWGLHPCNTFSGESYYVMWDAAGAYTTCVFTNKSSWDELSYVTLRLYSSVFNRLIVIKLQSWLYWKTSHKIATYLGLCGMPLGATTSSVAR